MQDWSWRHGLVVPVVVLALLGASVVALLRALPAGATQYCAVTRQLASLATPSPTGPPTSASGKPSPKPTTTKKPTKKPTTTKKPSTKATPTKKPTKKPTPSKKATPVATPSTPAATPTAPVLATDPRCVP